MNENERRDDLDRRDGDEPGSDGSERLTTAQVAAVQEAATHEDRAGETGNRTPMGPGPREADTDRESEPLFDEGEIGKHRERWQAIQADFVDDPRRAVKQADELVAELIGKLAKSFADERSKLEGQWDRGDDVSTEDMRVALRRYRSFFGRLLSV
jgi:hypothetical protein